MYSAIQWKKSSAAINSNCYTAYGLEEELKVEDIN